MTARLLAFDQRDILRAQEFLDALAPGNRDALAALLDIHPEDDPLLWAAAAGRAQTTIANLLRIIGSLTDS